MTIYEKITILGATDFSDNSNENIKKEHFDAVNEAIKSLGQDESYPYKIAFGRRSLNSHEFDYELDNIPDYIHELEDVLANANNKDVRFDKITVLTKREIDDNLNYEERAIESSEHQKCVMRKLKSKFNILKELELPEFNFTVDQDYETDSKYEVYHNDKGYFEQLHTNEELADYYRGETEDYLENEKFGTAYKFFVEKNKALNSDEKNLDLEFMKMIIEDYGTNTTKIVDAIREISDVKNETPEFVAKLLKDTLNTEEYKKAFDKNSEASKKITR